MGLAWLWVSATLVAVVASSQRGASLRGALEALQRRQRGHQRPLVAPSDDYEALYEFVPPQAYPEFDYENDALDEGQGPVPEYIIKVLGSNDRPQEAYEYQIVKKKTAHTEPEKLDKKESPFRERSHHSDNNKLKELFMDNNEEDIKHEAAKEDADAEYALLLGELWSKYRKHKTNTPQGVVKLYKDKNIQKRYSDNWGPIAFKRKRSSGPEYDHPRPETDEKKPSSDVIAADPAYNAYDVSDDDKSDMREEYAIAFQPLDDEGLVDPDEGQYSYDSADKPFPVSKRSSGQYFNTNYQKKRSPKNKENQKSKMFRSSAGTDPRIIKDLSKIFGEPNEVIKSPVKRSSGDESHESHEHFHPPQVLVGLHNDSHNHDVVHEENSHEQHTHIHHPGMNAEEEVTQVTEKPIIVKKKSIDWSDYFGIDKRKKKSNAFIDDAGQENLRKQYLDTFTKEVVYPLTIHSKHGKAKRNYVQAPTEIKNLDKRSNGNAKETLDAIDKKLRNMEGAIVEEALLYSEVGEELDSKEEQEMKEKLLSRLAAAYSLEKMRKALKDFKQSIQIQKNEASLNSSPVHVDEAKAKRVAVKKEKVQLTSNDIPELIKEAKEQDFEDEQGAGHYLNGRIEEQYFNKYMGGSGRHRVPALPTPVATGSCPVLARIVQRCGGVDLLAGDRGQLFLPLCSLHQICYLCDEAPPTTCDLVFLSEADTACEGDMSCQRAARSALMALRELHDNLADELDGECEASPCLPATLKLNLNWQRALQRR